MDYARPLFEFEAPEADGTPLSAHLRQAAKTAGTTMEELTGTEDSPCPREMEGLWEIFGELASARGANGFSPCPIGFVEVFSWMMINGIQLENWECKTIRLLDQLWFEVYDARSRRTKHHREK